MYTYFNRFLHRTPSHSDVNQQSTSMLSPSGLTRWSRSNQVANLPHLDTPIKSECDSYCAGRSMVEMLGVLAIIGVLSVGAIAGYSKAMMKYRLNKQAEQISWLLNVLYRYKAAFGESPQFMGLLPYFKQLGEIPENMITNDEQIYDIFGSRINMLTNSCYNDKCSEVMLLYDIAPSESFDICQNVFNAAKEFHADIARSGVYKYDSTATSYGSSYVGDKYCKAENCLKDITQEQIYTQCQYCDTHEQTCRFFFTFDIK